MWFRMLELIYSPFVLLLLSYNSGKIILKSQSIKPTTSSEITEINRTSPCPLSNNHGLPLLFYDHPNPEIRGCYPENGTIPCGENMKLFSINNESRFGECDCDVNSTRLLLFHKETNRCYHIFKQGYCEPGEQLVIRENNPLVPVCERTACFHKLKESAYKDEDWVPFAYNTTCVKVGDTCGSGNGRIIHFKQNRISPICYFPSRRPIIRTISAPHIRCSPGTYRAISGHCQPAFDWNDF